MSEKKEANIADKLAKSLGDIVKEKKTTKKTPKGKPQAGNKKGKQNAKNTKQTTGRKGPAGKKGQNGVAKKGQKGGRAGKFVTPRSEVRKQRMQREKQRKNSRDEGEKKSFSTKNKGTRLFIRNLHTEVVNSDLMELFEKCGRLKKCGINWDDLGRSKCTAEVEYHDAAHAREAIKEYNGAELDGKTMSVELAHSTGPRIQKKITKERTNERSRGGNNRRGGSRRPSKKN